MPLPYCRLVAAAVATGALCLTPATSPGAPPAAQSRAPSAKPASAPSTQTSKWSFSLLPKSFQKNPSLDLAVITELTDEGRQRLHPTPEAPEYYLAQASGFHAEGLGDMREQPVQIQKLTQQLETGLASSGYLPTTTGHPPTLALFFVWGIHGKPLEVSTDDGAPAFQDIGYVNLLSRAQLVGGKKFAQELARAINQAALTMNTGMSSIDPATAFAERDDLTRQLMEQIFDDVYYLVVSAYDSGALARGERKLLWRTKMTTAAQGVGLAETMPALVSSGAQFFGREMTVPATVTKRIQRGGKVELGTPVMKEYIEPDPAHPAK